MSLPKPALLLGALLCAAVAAASLLGPALWADDGWAQALQAAQRGARPGDLIALRAPDGLDAGALLRAHLAPDAAAWTLPEGDPWPEALERFPRLLLVGQGQPPPKLPLRETLAFGEVKLWILAPPTPQALYGDERAARPFLDVALVYGADVFPCPPEDERRACPNAGGHLSARWEPCGLRLLPPPPGRKLRLTAPRPLGATSLWLRWEADEAPKAPLTLQGGVTARALPLAPSGEQTLEAPNARDAALTLEWDGASPSGGLCLAWSWWGPPAAAPDPDAARACRLAGRAHTGERALRGYLQALSGQPCAP